MAMIRSLTQAWSSARGGITVKVRECEAEAAVADAIDADDRRGGAGDSTGACALAEALVPFFAAAGASDNARIN